MWDDERVPTYLTPKSAIMYTTKPYGADNYFS